MNTNQSNNSTYNTQYDLSSYNTSNPSYPQIMADPTKLIRNYEKYKHSDILDPVNKNQTIGGKNCSLLNLCVPNIQVSDDTKKLLDDSIYDKDGKPTDLDYKVSADIRNIADSIDKVPDAKLETSTPFAVGEIIYGQNSNITNLNYTKHKLINTEDLPDKQFANIAQTDQAVVKKEDVPCKPETQYTIPDLKSINWENSKEFKDSLDKLKNLMNENYTPENIKVNVTNTDLTDRTTNGAGIFDWLATSILNHLQAAKNMGLISNNDIAQIYTQTLVQALPVATQFALEKDKTNIANLLQLAQVKQANVQAMLAEAELLMLPAKLELAYAELEVQKKQVEISLYQAEVQKIQIPKEAATIDQIKEQTAVTCVQRALHLEALAQSELDRKAKQAGIEKAVIDIKASEIEARTKASLADQAEIATQSALVQLEGAKEDVKIKNTQWQLGLANTKLAKVQVILAKADTKIKAQQLLRDKEHTALIKAQAANYYAQVTATAEAIKAAKAQYSDTIDGAPVGGIIGAQINVNKAQAEAFERDSYYKFASLVSQGWNTKKAADIATLSPNVFTAFGVDRVFAKYTKYFNAPDNMFEIPKDYVDFLSDDDLDGNTPTRQTI